jgi:hypothetical protein
MSNQIPFGLRGGQLLGVEEVNSGLACDCICPQCGARLIARKGQENRHHFAHYQQTACEGALESALHLKAKSVIAEAQMLMLPAVYLHRQKRPFHSPRLASFTAIETEPFFQSFKPDLLLTKGPKQLIVEVVVTHDVDAKKLLKIRKSNIPALAINVFALYQDLLKHEVPFTTHDFVEEILFGTSHKHWIFNPQKERIEYGIRKRAAIRPVRHYFHKGFHNYYVAHCPLEKRSWPTTGFYASVFQDCAYCSRCLEINYHKSWVGFKEVSERPKSVTCWGNLPMPKAYKNSVPF